MGAELDLVLQKGREKFLVQRKQWKAFKVGVQVVRELYGLIAAAGAAGGFRSSAMVIKTATRGPNAGGTFWGCSSYPSCRGTRQA